MKILILEDEAIIAESLYQILLQLEYEPLDPVITPEEAIDCIEKDKPHLAILDLTLQDGRSGLEVAKYLTEKHSQIPFIILTAHSDPATIAEVKLYKPAAYLVKPWARETLFATIEMALPTEDELQDTNGQATETAVNKDTELYIKIGTRHEKVDLQKIIALQAAGKYTELHFADQPKRLIRVPLSQFMLNFPVISWLRTHKSHAVNPIAITWIGTDEMEVGGLRIPIGRFFQPAIESFVQNRL